MYALKYAHLLKDKCGHDTEIYNFYIDMRCFGKGYEEFYKKVQSEGVKMIRGKAGSITEDENGILTVKGEDTLSNRLIEIQVEMVILCTAMEARPDAPDVMRKFGIGIGSDGFFQESASQTGAGIHPHERRLPGRGLSGTEGYPGHGGPGEGSRGGMPGVDLRGSG